MHKWYKTSHSLFMKADYINKNSKGNLFMLKLYVYSNFRPLGLCLFGLGNGDEAHNINPVICFLTKAKWPKI